MDRVLLWASLSKEERKAVLLMIRLRQETREEEFYKHHPEKKLRGVVTPKYITERKE